MRRALVCARCEAPQPLPSDLDLYGVLDLPRRLVLDRDDLERRYHLASKAVHPDRFQTAGDRDRELSLQASAAVNRAYRTLRDPVARGRYWLELHGNPLGSDNKEVPPALAAEVFETQELLEEMRHGGGDAARRAVVQRQGELTDRLAALGRELEGRFAAWDAASAGASPEGLAELKRRLSEVAYLDTLASDVEETLDA